MALLPPPPYPGLAIAYSLLTKNVLCNLCMFSFIHIHMGNTFDIFGHLVNVIIVCLVSVSE